MNPLKRKVPIFNQVLLRNIHFIIRLTILFILSFPIASCQLIIRKESCVDLPDSGADAAKFISSITIRKDTNNTVKGLGKLTLWDSNGVQTSRAAWAGVADGRLRIEMLSLPGQPVAKIIYDGEDYVFLSSLDQRTYRKSGVDGDLKSLTGIPVPSADVIKLLSGVIPVQDYEEAAFQYGAPDCGNMLVLKQKWHGVVEKLFLNDAHDRVVKVEMYRWGRILYRAELERMQRVEGREVPFRLVFSNANQKGFSVDVEKCWLDIEIPDDVFVIQTE